MNTSNSNYPKLFFLLLFIGFKGFAQSSPPLGGPLGVGQWGEVIAFDLVPVAIANLPDGRLVTWSSKYHDAFDMNDGYTFTQMFDPLGNGGLGAVLPIKVTETFHDMFCPGINNLADGRLLVTGGSSDEKTSIYDPKTGIWEFAPNMQIARGYQGAVTLADGSAFTIGGSWNDAPPGGRDAELWEDGAWRELTGLKATILYNVNDIAGEPEGVYRLDNHAWLWAAPNGKVFHAGPGEIMNWIDVSNNGSYVAIGQRGDDHMSMNGNTSMYDIGKILKVGGNQSYDRNHLSNDNSYIIDINDGDVVTVIPTNNKLEHARTYVSSVVLPNGEVLILGGMATSVVFSDEGSYLSAEMFSPSNNSFRTLASMEVPRTYHSAGILLNDGRVFMGGGGLCGEICPANHKDAEIYSPPYLFESSGELADRPILNARDKAFYETIFTVSATSGVQEFAFMRMSSATHSVNNEQRRVPVTFTENNGYYALNIPEANLMPPGYYMLFAIKDGVPSISESVLIGPSDPLYNGDHLLVEFDFMEGSGASISDGSGNNNHGTIKQHDDSGQPVALRPSGYWSANGLSGNALEMDGMEFNSNSIVEIPTSTSLAALTDKITVMAWVNRNTGSIIPGQNDIPNVGVFTHLGIHSERIEYASFFMGYHANQYKLEFFTDNEVGGVGNDQASIYTGTYNPGQWEHLVGTYDGNTALLYVNGAEIGRSNASGNLIISKDNVNPLYNDFTLSGFYETRQYPIVNYGNQSGITDELDGRMDKFKLYNIALTELEILRIYNEEKRIVVDQDPCDEFTLVYEINGKRDRGANQISVRHGAAIGLSLNVADVDYVVTDSNNNVIVGGIIPNITISEDYTVAATFSEIGPATGGSLLAVCSEQIESRADRGMHAFDGKANTFWHTLWGGDQEEPICAHNHYIDLDLGANSEFGIIGLNYLPRPNENDAEKDLNGTITSYNIFISNTTDDLGNVVWGSPIVTDGKWAYNRDEKTARFPETFGRYVRLEAISTGAYILEDHNKFASAAEINVIVNKTTECEKTMQIKVEMPRVYSFNGAWLNDIDPSGVSREFDDIIIGSGEALIDKSTVCYSLTVEAGAALILEDIEFGTTVNLTVKNNTTLNSTSTSFASFIDNGYLTGVVNYNRHVNKIGTSDGGGNDLISSPVTSVKFDAAFVAANPLLAQNPGIPGQFAFAPYNVDEGVYQNFDLNQSSSIDIVSGLGYRVATTDLQNPTSFNGGLLSFRGRTTRNQVNVPIVGGGEGKAWNLIGNPYPSYLHFRAFFDSNRNQFESGQAYQAIYGYNGGATDKWEILNLASVYDNYLIAPGQGFFVKAQSSGGNVMFSPDMRRIGSSDDFVPNRTKNSNRALSKLKLSRGSNEASTSIYFIEGTTRGLDPGYDAGAFTGAKSDFSIFTNLLEDHMGIDIAIQSLPYEDFHNVVVPLGIKARSGAELSIRIDDLSTIPTNINVYLEDTLTNTLTLLNNEVFKFTPTLNLNSADRFFIHYSSKTLSTNDLYSDQDLRIYTKIVPKVLVIKGVLTSSTTAQLYDIQGRLVLKKVLNLNSTNNTIDISTISVGVYVIKMTSDNQVKTQKLVIK